MGYVLSPQARDSLKGIRAYTLKTYGKKQTNVYLSQLRDAMRRAAKRSGDVGTSCDDIKKGYFFVRAGKHHIYYRISDSHIEIIDVLHQRMEPTLHI